MPSNANYVRGVQGGTVARVVA
ncbi:hypothetical protein F4Y59_06150 [Candidatus Poribacteria bacterium]|nr:hypothetical protein [Candidatus Poribacteria bacterium]MYK18031.1 hypothetical protein [Candidatus Poribacteria bacterium]